MKFRTLGNSGLVVSEIGLGTDNFGYRQDIDVPAIVNTALDAGVTLFDTADVYADGRAEMLLSEALGEKRKNVIVATKWGVPLGLPFGQIEGAKPHRGASRDYILTAPGNPARPKLPALPFLNRRFSCSVLNPADRRGAAELMSKTVIVRIWN